MTRTELQNLPHRTVEELRSIPHVTLQIKSDSPNMPAFLHGSKTTVYGFEKTDGGWVGFTRMPRTGDFVSQSQSFDAVDYAEVV